MNKTLLDTIKWYYFTLETNGYIKKKEVYKLLYFIFVEEFLNDNVGYITEKDFNSITRSLNFMGTSCPLPYFLYKKQHIDKRNVKVDFLKKTQFEESRQEENKLQSAFI